MSALDVEDILGNRQLRGSIRFHPIDWNAKNIPIKKSDIDWIGYYANNSEFEIVQFHISKALGRVIGFLDEESVFQIVLLDPMHNIQPAKAFDHRIRVTYAAACEFTALTTRFEQTVVSCEHLSEGQKKEMLNSMQNGFGEFSGGAVLLNITDDHLNRLLDLASAGVVGRLGEVLEFAIEELSK